MKTQKGIAGIIILISLAVVAVSAGAFYMVASKSNAGSGTSQSIWQRLRNITTPKAPIGNISPAANIKGTWTSSIAGKGLQLAGEFDTGPSTTKIYETGDITLIIDNVSGNTASGTIRYTNMCSSGATSIPGYTNFSVPQTCVADTGASAINIRVSGSRLDFGTISQEGVKLTMQGNYTSNIISGTMTATTPYGTVKGEFNLTKRQ